METHRSGPSTAAVREGRASRGLWPTLVVALFAVSVVGAPFQLLRANSGRYLLPVFRAGNGALFSGDPVVDSIGRFRSAFYDGLGEGARLSSASAAQVSHVLSALYVLSKLALIASLVFLGRSLHGGIVLSGVLAAWACHPKPLPVGGVSLFSPMMTHAEVALILGLVGLGMRLRGHRWAFWTLLGTAVFVHSLIAFQLALIVVPCLPLLPSWSPREELKGIGFLGALSLVYLKFMAPPRLSPAETEIFLRAKGEMQHVSPWQQGTLGWVLLFATLALAIGLSIRILGADPRFRFLSAAACWGTACGLVLSITAASTGSAQIALFQPMRLFLWVTILCWILIAAATDQALRDGVPIGMPLLALFGLAILGSLWQLALLLTLAPLIAAGAAIRPAQSRNLVLVGTVLFAGAILVGWIAGRQGRWETLHDPWPVALAVFLAAVVLWGRRSNLPPTTLSAAAISLSLIGASMFWHRYYDRRIDPAWDSVGLWCQAHSQPTDRFLTPPDGDNFRARALRTSLTERCSALAWVDPLLYQQLDRTADRVQGAYRGQRWDLAELIRQARQLGARFIVIRGEADSAEAPVYRAGSYRVFSVSQDENPPTGKN